MENKILNKMDALSSDLINSILEVVRINSLKSEPSHGAPFGVGIKEALTKALDISKSLGFNVKNIDDKIGYASYGEGEDYVCVIGHLDVVPTGEGWKHPPFSGYVENNTIYSRGVLDNKGPTLSCLYAMYALKELGIEPNREIRIIFGCDEETGEFNDLKHYLSIEKPPIMGFTPDCKYPVVYSERGRCILKIIGSDDNIDNFYKFINTYILNTRNRGERLQIDFEDKEFGVLELKKYIFEKKDDESILNITISYPFGTDSDKIINRVYECVSKYEGLRCEIENTFNPVMFPKDSFMIRCMQDAYEYVTGMDGTPVTTSGGTYAKMMPNIVPFGPSFPGQKDISHNPNEWMTFEDIITNAKIYALTLYNLTKKER